MVIAATQTYTAEEYLKREVKSDIRSEFRAGEIVETGEKFAQYRTIETFQEYVLIDQYRPHVEHYVKQTTKQWLFTEYDSLEATFKLSSVPVEITLADLYEAIEFAAG